jgi:hypothetical protein
MKTLLLLLLIVSCNAHAITFAVIGPCSSKPLHAGNFPTDLSESVGKISLDIFDAHKIPYVGSADGMSSIVNTPVGDDALEILSDTKMRAYGWCFSINGEVPDRLSSQVNFENQKDYLTWFYAYSTYDQGVWTDYCVPSYKIKSPQFCK